MKKGRRIENLKNKDLNQDSGLKKLKKRIKKRGFRISKKDKSFLLGFMIMTEWPRHSEVKGGSGPDKSKSPKTKLLLYYP